MFALPVPSLMAQVTDDQVTRACNVDELRQSRLVCRAVFEWTENETLARAVDWLASAPFRILLILLVSVVLRRLLRRLIDTFVAEMSEKQLRERMSVLDRLKPPKLRNERRAVQPLRAAARAETIGSVLNNIASIVIFSIAVLLALSEVGINLAPLIAGAGIAGVALGFGAQSLVKDFLSGLFMLVEDQYGVGDVIDVGEATGTVEAVNLRTTRMRDVDGTVWHVPNGEIQRVGNMSQQWARALLDIAVAYDTDLDAAMDIVKDLADTLWRESPWNDLILEEPEVWGVQALEADGITIRLVLKTRPGEQWKVSRELNRRLKRRFDDAGIEIPFPQRVMWMRRDMGSSRSEEMLDDGSAEMLDDGSADATTDRNAAATRTGDREPDGGDTAEHGR